MHKFSIRHYISRLQKISFSLSLLVILLSFCIPSIHAKEITIPYINTEIRFQKLDTYDGLSQSFAYDIVQDKQGFIWVATDDGLNRYDGTEFVHYRSDVFDPHSIAHNFIRNLFIDKSGTLWIGTYDGLSRYNPKLDNFDNFTHEDRNPESLSDNIIWDVYQDNKNVIWVSTESGLHKYDPISETFSTIKVRGITEQLKEIKTIFQDAKGNYWLGTYENGIYIISEDFSFAVSLDDKNKWNLQLPTDSLHQIETIDDNYWLATNNGVFVINQAYQIIEKFQFNDSKSPSLITSIKSIKNVNNTHVWLATNNGIKVINLLSGEISEYYTDKNIHTSISHDDIFSLEKDAYNKIWIGSRNGVNIYDPNANLLKSSNQISPLLNSSVESFIELDNSVWFSSNGELYKLDDKNKTLQHVKTDLKTPIYQLVSNGSSILLLTENDELYSLATNGEITQHPLWKNILQLEAWRKVIFLESDVWFINIDGMLTSYNIETKKISNKPSIQHHKILAFDIDKKLDKNIFWLVTDDGSIYQYNITQDKLINIPYIAQDNFVTSKTISIKSNNNWLLLGSESQGVLLINKLTQKTYVFNEKSGLSNNFIADIQIDENNNYWFSTNKGISALSTKTQKVRTFESPFDLKNNEYLNGSSLITNSGIAYFGGLKGFRYFNIADLQPTTHHFNKPILTRLLIANKEIKVGMKPQAQNEQSKPSELYIPQQLNNLDLLTLKYIHSPITIEFSSPNAEMPQDITYRYRLKGLEDNWIETSSDKGYATYTNLSAGNYTFELQVYDVLDPTVFKSKNLPLHIQPPWWLSNSAILIYSLMTLLVIAYLFQQMRHKRLYHLQIKQSEERLKLSLWGSGDEMWDWNIKSGKIYRSNIWGILEFPQDGKRNVGGDKTNVHENDMPRIRDALDEHFNEKTDHFEATYRVRNKDNQWVWVLDRGKVVERDEKNQPTRMTGTLKDISQIKKADERLKLFAKCIENISDAVIIYDRLFNIVDVNKSYQRITNKTKRQMIGTSMKFSQYPDSFTQNVKKHLLQKNGWHGEIESVRDNGEVYLTDLNIDIIRDESGNISHFVGVFSDITKRKETEAELRKLANTDTLTTLPNRSYFQANQLRLVKSTIPHALLVFDLDNFKKVNDSMGHEVGDILLCKVAERLRSVGRSHDTVYRLGGDEFSIIVEDTNDIHTITSIAKQILKTIAEPLKLRNQEVVLFSSIGIVLYPEDGANPHELLKNADTAMYHAKNAGGNRYQFFSDSMNKKAVKRLQIENLIRHGLKEDYFSVFYQPKIEISTGKIAGMEALVRFETPSKGIISPVVFIPVSEETGQIIDIGEIVLRKACFATKQWVDSGLFDGRIAVNLSAVQFTQPNLVGMISDILKESQLPAKYLELEITEGTVMDSPQAAIDTMLQIRAMGIHLSLDDFGTGYSSLAYLKKFPLNTLKIDKAFVDDIETSEQGRNMVATIVTIAHNLGLQVVAEGVETNQQLSFLAGLRCEQLQGYLYSKPLPEKDFRSYLLSHQITDKSTSFNKY
ncbi:EAL domain-containing protein [Thalassotalea profundi]|uniref:Diguanylate cyclase n=1 Tax=Thalassotalea profundi TaxID=2036687 RepID=A0ABQ3IGC1_9GAMM|nr:EAL domain-containing protein [Thalassotalea profundi]GHE80301.1 diguanylate cyclase [Thalassotalea profundi]